MTDAKRLIQDFEQLVSESPTRIAPERDKELLNEVFGGKICDLKFAEGPANFLANVDEGFVEARYAGLLSIWATAYACVLLIDEVAKARDASQSTLKPTGETQQAYALLEAAKRVIADHMFKWPDELPAPEYDAPEGTVAWRTDNLFLGATAWVILHEIAHLKLGHEVLSTVERQMQEEFEADAWAASWILKQPRSEAEQEFRLLSVGIGVVWLGLVEEVRGTGDGIHPPAFERLAKCSRQFPFVEDSPASGMVADVLKVVFDPVSQITAEHASDALASVAIRLARGQHMQRPGS